MDLVGDYVCYGTPCVWQDRNEHNLFHDLDMERVGYEHADGLCEILREFKLPDRLTDYSVGMEELLYFLEGKVRSRMPKFWDWFRVSWEGMALWANIFRK